MSSAVYLKKNIEAFSGSGNGTAFHAPLSRVEAARRRGLERRSLTERPIAAPDNAEVVCLGAVGIASLGPVLDKGARVVVIEPDLEHVARVLSREDLSAAIRAGEVEIIVNLDPHEVVRQWEPARRGRNAAQLVLVNGAGAEPTRAEYFRVLLDGIQARERDQALDSGAMIALGELAVSNAVSNLAKLQTAFPSGLLERFRGRPAIVVAAGPSLDDNAATLSGLEERALLVAVDTAVKPLRAHGVEPHLVVGVDPRERNVHNLDGAELGRSFIITELSCHPSLASRPSAGAAWVIADGAVGRALSKLDVGVPLLSMYGSVATAAFELVCRMGASQVVFMGQDLAFTGGQHYGAHVERRSSVAPERGEIRVVEDMHGQQVETTERLLAFRDWLEARILHYPATTFLNATGAGILKRGVEQVSAASLVKRFAAERFDARAALAETFAASTGDDTCGRRAVLRLREETRECLDILSSSEHRPKDAFLPAYLARETAAGLTEVLCAEPLRALAARWNGGPQQRRERELRRILGRGAHRLDHMVSAALDEGASR